MTTTTTTTSCSLSGCGKENVSLAALNRSPLSAAKKTIDDEIKEIENEIKRLNTRLEALRLKKAREKRGRVVAAKFMEPPKQGLVKNIEDTPNARMRRGVSIGPAEIVAEGGRFRKADVAVIAPVPEMQSNRRKACFWKLQDVNEGKGMWERRQSFSVSPGRQGKIVGRVSSVQGQRQAATTISGSRKCMKKDDGVLALVQPRKLVFKEGEVKTVVNTSSKTPVVKPGRVVASRYNQIGNRSSGNSLAVDDKKRRATASLPVRVKKRWEIPAEVEVYKSQQEDEEQEEASVLSSSVADVSDVLLPKIRTLQCSKESPRDSGAAKRVSELAGEKSYFNPDEDDKEASICPVLIFVEEDDDKEG